MGSASTNSEADVAPTLTSAVAPNAICQELEAICGHRQFSSSRKNCEFLKYVVSETLAGRGDELKERTLGIKLYGRPLSYDTGSDSVVRVRASDLRKRLSLYYEENTSTTGWRIHLPLHSYVPVFQPEVVPQEAPGHNLFRMGRPRATKPLLSLRQLIQPTLVALFLCAATFRWEVFSSTPYQDFWTTLLGGRSVIVLVLDTHSSNPGEISIDDLNLTEPLQRTALAFHASMRIESSSDTVPANSEAVLVHLTHDLPRATQRMIDPDEAYITVVPGNRPELWVRGGTSKGLQLTIDSISSADDFPFALENALHSNADNQIRISRKSNGQLSAVVDHEPWPH